MSRPIRRRTVVPARPPARATGRCFQQLCLPCLFALAVAGGCDDSGGTPPPVPAGTFSAGAAPGPARVNEPSLVPGGAPSTAPAAAAEVQAVGDDAGVRKAVILDNVIKLIQTAAVTPGGDSFGNATKNLNQYFSTTPASEYKLPGPARAFLQETIAREQVDELESPTWARPDARHIEDCMLYQGIATRVAGVSGDDLTRVRRVFDWMVKQVQLVPPESLGSPGLKQAQARPFDVLLRGMAVEAGGSWSERGWLFLSLCRQLGLDAGLVTYTPPQVQEPIVWCVAVLVDDKPYLFDPRVGLPVPGPEGRPVATLDEALTDPWVLDQMDLPGQLPYYTTQGTLAASKTKIGIQIDSGTRYFSPRMKLLQESLAGKNATVLYRDPAAQRDHWAKALGPRLGKVGLWELPRFVEAQLFTNAAFVESTQRSLILFRSEFPLLYARMKQLRGETPAAIEDYVTFRFAENALMMDKKTPMPPEVQHALDVYSTYFLAMCHLDQDNPEKAKFFFEKTLLLLPNPGPGQPFYTFFRWGAQANLARLYEAKGETAKAVSYYSAVDATMQRHGNLLRARDLVWPDPMGPLPPPLPTPPPPVTPDGVQAAVQPPAAPQP
ncbi:MAG: hypothetical protein U0835_03360 [Isosphaeraceae bacterium]